MGLESQEPLLAGGLGPSEGQRGDGTSRQMPGGGHLPCVTAEHPMSCLVLPGSTRPLWLCSSLSLRAVSHSAVLPGPMELGIVKAVTLPHMAPPSPSRCQPASQNTASWEDTLPA